MREEFVGVGFQKAVHSDDLPALLDRWNTHLANGNKCEVEIRYRKRMACINGCLPVPARSEMRLGKSAGGTGRIQIFMIW